MQIESELHEFQTKLRKSQNDKRKVEFDLQKTRQELKSLSKEREQLRKVEKEKEEQDSLKDESIDLEKQEMTRDVSMEKLQQLEREYLETQSIINKLQTEIDELRSSREELKHELNQKETENLCWREWKDSQAAKTLKERENKFIQEKVSWLIMFGSSY